MTGFVSIFAVTLMLTGSLVTPAFALNSRTWISGTGSDAAGCGVIASPCRTLQFAHNQTSAGGEIDIKDSAGYGSVTITKAITIVGDGSLAGVLAAPGSDAITINAGANDAVVLRGLTIEGAKVAYNGIVFNSGGALTIANCIVQGFARVAGASGYGIWIKHTAGEPMITITDTTASYNDTIGIVFSPSGSGGGQWGIVGSIASHNGFGISIYTADTSASQVRTTVSNSHAMNNASAGFQFYGNHHTSTLIHSVAGNNLGYGIIVSSSANLLVSHVVATNNKLNDMYATSAWVYSDKTSVFNYDNLVAGSNYFTVTNR